MADKPLPWFRAYPEAAHDPKFDIVARQAGMDSLTVFGAWWKILCLAGSSPVRGSLYVTTTKRFTIDDVTALLRVSNEHCNTLMNAFIDLEMIDIDENGAYHIKNWEKRQFESDSSTERVRQFRERQKKGSNTPDETLHGGYSNDGVTPPENREQTTDPEADTEKREEDPPSAFDLTLHMVEDITGLPCGGPESVKAVDEIAAMSATREDIQAGYDWLTSNQKTVKFYNQLIGPTRTANAKRLQNGRASPAHVKTYKDADGNPVQVRQ